MLSKRFEEIISRIPKCQTILDIGCDHGKVTYEILKRGICEKALLSDISEPSLLKAKILIEEEFPNSQYFVSDGAKSVTEHFDFCIIAGMGGQEILKILQSNKIKNALIQPMNNLVFVRNQVQDMGFMIVTDEIIFDERYYNIIKIQRNTEFQANTQQLSENEIYFGKTNLEKRSDEFIAYLKFQIRVQNDILKSLSKGEKYNEVAKYISKINEVLNSED